MMFTQQTEATTCPTIEPTSREGGSAARKSLRVNLAERRRAVTKTPKHTGVHGEFQIRLKFRGLGAGRIAHARSDHSTSPPDHNNSETRSTQRGARRSSRIGCYQTSVTDPQPFASACAKSLRAGSAHRWNLFVLD